MSRRDTGFIDGNRVMNDWRADVTYTLGAFGIYLFGDIAHWALRGWPGREVIASRVILPAYLLTFLVSTIAVALGTKKHPIATSAAASGIAVFALWAAKIPLTLLLPGLIQRDHDRWVEGALSEGVEVGCIATVIAAGLAAAVRLVMKRWKPRLTGVSSSR